ncbi:hypothetical protein Bca52824_028595 [Brassica carinata]|uniref:PDZ domain-containing protein n=1 Tax=Brassica carinata TaxID=52824 RepID=A0A8X8ARV9_BRACI|nr:hypothetical protein Bca52824_028595 [Brassica carinata]
MLLTISPFPVSHRNPHFLSSFNTPTPFLPLRSKTHLSKSHLYSNLSALPKQMLSVGLPVQEVFPGVLVPEVKTLSAASRDGLLAGDVILAVDGTELSKTGPDAVSKVVDIVKRNRKSGVLFRVERRSQDFDIRFTPDKNFYGTGKIGVQLSPNVRITKVRPRNIPETFRFAGKEFMGLSSNVLDGLKKLSGPVAIIAVGAEVARSNIDGLYQFAALLNINLAVINLLPLPALDGGTLALIVLEAVRGGRKLPVEVEQGIMSSGIVFVLFIGLFSLSRIHLALILLEKCCNYISFAKIKVF